MAELREVYEMTTKQMEPDQDSWRKQEERHHRDTRRKKFAALTIAAAMGVAALVVVIQAQDEGSGTQLGGEPNGGSAIPTGVPIPALPASGTVDPGRYIFSSSDPAFDASHRITIDVVDGYESFDNVAVLKDSSSVSTLAISDVYADPCQWQGSLLDGAAIASTDGVVTALASQVGLPVSTPTAVTVDGFDGTYMERRVPANIDMSTCDLSQFRVYRSPEFGGRLLHSGQRQLLWILDVDGVPLVIDATLAEGASAQDRAELEKMAESIQIEPVN